MVFLEFWLVFQGFFNTVTQNLYILFSRWLVNKKLHKFLVKSISKTLENYQNSRKTIRHSSILQLMKEITIKKLCFKKKITKMA